MSQKKCRFAGRMWRAAALKEASAGPFSPLTHAHELVSAGVEFKQRGKACHHAPHTWGRVTLGLAPYFKVQSRDVAVSDTHVQGKPRFLVTHRWIRRPNSMRAGFPAMADGPGTSWDHVEARWDQRGVLYMSGQAIVQPCLTIARVVVSGSTFRPMLGDYALHQLPVVLVKSR